MDAEAEPTALADPAALTFFLHKDGVTYGPESAGNLWALWNEGWVQPEDLLWREGEAEWVAAGDVFAPVTPAEIDDTPVASARQMEFTDDDFQPSSIVPVLEERKWPLGSFGIAVLAHIALLLLVVGWLHFFPVRIDPYTVPPSHEPPMEVTMVPEDEPAPPPPPPPVDQTPPPPQPELTPPPPPVPLPDLPPPPPAPVDMPLPAPPPLPTEPNLVPQEVAPVLPTHSAPPKIHRAVAKAVTRPTPLPPPVQPAEESDEQPQYLSNPRPIYPIAARERHQEGTVILLVTVNAGGIPVSVSVEQSSGVGILDAAARKKVSADWRFKPGSAATVRVPVEFHLDQPN